MIMYRLYFVNWQRDISIEERDGRKVVVKRNKSTKEFHEFLIDYTYSLISLLLVRPSAPATLQEISSNEGHLMRASLAKLGILTPELVAIADEFIVEEFVDGGDLYAFFGTSGSAGLASVAGVLTGKLHRAGYAFVDNKAQNYLVRGNTLVRTDLGFTRKTNSPFAMSMDIGSFLASVMDLRSYPEIEQAFYSGYVSEASRKFSYRAIIIRNLLTLGFSSDSTIMLQNMVRDSRPLLEG